MDEVGAEWEYVMLDTLVFKNKDVGEDGEEMGDDIQFNKQELAPDQ